MVFVSVYLFLLRSDTNYEKSASSSFILSRPANFNIKEEDSCSEVSESLHMSSLSCVGADLEIVEQGTKESLMQKFTRLHCEVCEHHRYYIILKRKFRQSYLVTLII